VLCAGTSVAPVLAVRRQHRPLARGLRLSKPLRPIADRTVAGAYLERALTELSARLNTTKDTADPDATGKAS
jgi:hypothetical protein